VAKVELLPSVVVDFDRILDHLVLHGVADAPDRIAGIINAFQLLTHSPQIGRPVGAGKRELVIGRKSRGYVALYRYAEGIDTVFIMAVRGQSESPGPA
jgi:toxin ParE1/3/4